MEKFKSKFNKGKIKILLIILTVCLFSLCFSSCGNLNTNSTYKNTTNTNSNIVNFDDLKALEGVIMIPEKLTYATDVEEIKVTWENNSSKSITFGDYYYLEKNTNDKWVKIKFPDGIAFNDIGYLIKPYGKYSHIYRPNDILNLEAGIYRIVINYSCEKDNYYVYAEITLTDETGLLESSKGYFYKTEFGEGLANFPSDAYPPKSSDRVYDSDVVVFSSQEELQTMFSETYSQTYSSESQSFIRNEEFTNLINGYDEEFFESNELVTFVVSASGGAYYYVFSKAVYVDGVLTIEIEQQSRGEGHCAIVPWFAIIEVEKVPKDTQINYVLKSRGW